VQGFLEPAVGLSAQFKCFFTRWQGDIKADELVMEKFHASERKKNVLAMMSASGAQSSVASQVVALQSQGSVQGAPDDIASYA